MNFSDKVVYQIYPKSFSDSNGDGLGDIRGIINHLDYLKTLGVDYIWSTPFFVSPQNDNGYDVADYRAIDPRFGTMADVEELIAEADKRGIGLMFDMVFNHTSTEHEWFQRALKGEQKYIDYYIFKDGTPDKAPTNWENPEVRAELKDILRFWKSKGVKGFRFDVVNLISKPEQFIDGGIDGMITVGEMSSTSLDNCIRYSNPNEHELSMVFNFHHLKVDYKDGQKWELMPPDIAALKKLFATWQEGMAAARGLSFRRRSSDSRQDACLLPPALETTVARPCSGLLSELRKSLPIVADGDIKFIETEELRPFEAVVLRFSLTTKF
ncbi:MAG: hypothetical protein IJU71_08770 [Selenomonadaceae bacterium]|nr:hypothetical protein [Selenomonadaceae bacterium]